MPLEIWLPVKPYRINQKFGANPTYYAKFSDGSGNPLKGHNGVDLFAPHATPLYAPCDGLAWYKVDDHGGDGIYIATPDKKYEVILWHLCSKDDPQFAPKIPTDGNAVQVKCGQLIGYTDNSGAPYESSGDHLHIGLIPLNAIEKPLYPNNGFNGCIDPEPFFNMRFAEDYEITEKALASAEAAVVSIKPSIPVAQTNVILQAVKSLLTFLSNFFSK